MGVTFLDIAAIVLYFSCMGWFAWLTRRTKTFSEFSVASHSIPASMIFASLCATYVGPGFAVGMTSKGFSSGYVFYFMALAFVLQTILVGAFVAPMLSEKFRNCHTLGDVIESLYGRFAHLLTGIVSVGLCIGFCAIMAKIGGVMLQAVTGWDLMLCIGIGTSIVALYTMSGGIRASIATDALQFGLFSIMIPILLIVAVWKAPAGQDIGAKALALTADGFAGLTPIQILGIFLSFLLGETLVPPYANRALASKSSGDSRKGFLFSGVFGVFWLAVVITFGVYGHAYVAAGTAPDDVFLTMGRDLLPQGAFGLLLAALIAIVMSSQDSVLNAGAVALVRDIIGVHKQPSDTHSLLMGRIGTVLIAIAAAIVALYSPSIIDGLLICYSIWAPSILLPLLIGLFKKKTVPMAGWLSMLAGGITSILWQGPLKNPGEVPAILAGLIAGALAYVVGDLIGRNPIVRKETV
jgi:SSS family solute:Na+ symporter